MTGPGRRRMILRRMDMQAPASAEIARTIAASSTVTLLQNNGSSTLLVEGDPEEIVRLVADVPGWSAMPLTTYEVPDARPRVRRPGPER